MLVSVVTMLAAGALVNVARAQGDTPPAVPGGKSVTTALYTVKDGNQVDPKTLAGWKTWRAMACERCHGASQEGLVGPALVNSLKVLTKDQFHTTVTQGRLEKGMPNFGGVQLVVDNWENLYAYLKGRSDGNIAAGHLYPMQADQKSAKK
jgi:mono/diheme cytochrome c family protein